MKRKSEKQIARETAEHISMVKKSRKEASIQNEAALFAAASILRFHGELVIHSREVAITKAMEMSRCEEGHMILFTDGAVHIQKNQDGTVHRASPEQAQCQSRRPHLRRNKVKLAAAIAYRVAKSSEWTVRAFTVPTRGRGRYYLEAELAGIVGALGIAILRIKDSRKKASITPQKVVILTDCQGAISQLQKLRGHASNWKSQDGSLACKLVTRSQHLHDLGVLLEVHWIPGHHSAISGNIRADNEARRTAKSDMNIYEWELLQVEI
jgi:ribonuclease HI